VRVVDTDQNPTLTLLSDKGIDQAADIGHQLRDRVADRRGEGSQRKWLGGLGTDDPGGVFAGGLGARQYLTGKTRLPHPCGADDDDPATVPTPAECTADDGELVIPAVQRISADHGPTITSAPDAPLEFGNASDHGQSIGAVHLRRRPGSRVTRTPSRADADTAITAGVAAALRYLGVFVFDAVESVTAMAVALDALITVSPARSTSSRPVSRSPQTTRDAPATVRSSPALDT
jgi:hypothetical protein